MGVRGGLFTLSAMRLLCDTGRITLDGVDFRDFNLYSLHQQFAVVAQDTELFAGTVKENIVYGMNEDSWDEAALVEATKAASAHDFIMSFEDGMSFSMYCGPVRFVFVCFFVAIVIKGPFLCFVFHVFTVAIYLVAESHT